MNIAIDIVKKLIKEQFPKWEELEIRPVEKSGHDNRTFHLGDTMTVRLPSGKDYAAQVAKESQWLPYLQEYLDYPISKPIATGKPAEYYPFPWSINVWLNGETLLEDKEVDKKILALELAKALKKLQAIDCSKGPEGGLHNFYRGCDLKVWNESALEALHHLKETLPTNQLLDIWNRCISSIYQEKAVWVHGDIAPGNILCRNHHFYGLIDFGVLGKGDPACEYAMAWTYFDKVSRNIFLSGLPDDMIDRAKGWALWKALITYNDVNVDFKENAHLTIWEILSEE